MKLNQGLKCVALVVSVIINADVVRAQSQTAETIRFTRDPLSGRIVKSEIIPSAAKQVSSKSLRNAAPTTAAAAAATTAAATPSTTPSVSPTKDPVLTTNNFWKNNGSAFGFSRVSSNLVAVKTEKDKLGMTHVRYRQRYNGIPVLGAEALAHVGADGELKTVNGQVAGWINPKAGLVPTVESKKAAIDAGVNQFKKEYGVNGTADAVISRVIIAPGILNNTTEKTAYVTWAVGVTAAGTVAVSTVYYVDAVNAKIRFRQERERQLNRRIYDCTANPSSGQCYSSLVVNDYHYGRREGEASWGPNPVFNANDTDLAYDVLGAVHNYLLATFGRNGANGSGELGPIGSSFAAYTGMQVYLDAVREPNCTYAAFRPDGYLSMCHAVTVPDIIAHEYAHGITYSVRPLTYSGQTGALDESFSDVFGEIVEKKYLGNTDWINGSGVVFPGATNDTGLRNLKDPPMTAGGGVDALPDRFYSAKVFCTNADNGGVHWNSTILSHAAYLMSEGTPFAQAFNGCTIRPIGMEKMEQVMFRANVNYYSANANFFEAYLAWNQACADLYGESSDTCIQVKRALQAVELNQPGACSGVTRVTPECQDVCQDSDNGIDVFTPGAVSDAKSGKALKDTCVIVNTSVAENYCDGDRAEARVIQCANGCDSAIRACRAL